jgi:hypothetical protein
MVPTKYITKIGNVTGLANKSTKYARKIMVSMQKLNGPTGTYGKFQKELKSTPQSTYIE